MRHVVTGKKNWMFKGSVAAGERAANLLTIVGSAIRNDLDVRTYLNDVAMRASRRDGLVDPNAHAWKAENPNHVRVYRSDERRSAVDRKRTRRARRRALARK